MIGLLKAAGRSSPYLRSKLPTLPTYDMPCVGLGWRREQDDESIVCCCRLISALAGLTYHGH
jgi:hypothetical protein